MKLFYGSIAPILAVCCLVNACKRTPPPPSEKDAASVWNNIHKARHLDALVKLEQTNGQMSEINGVKVYTFYYKATEKNLVQIGAQPAGAVDTYTSNFPFEWTEKGWKGPDNQIYPVN